VSDEFESPARVVIMGFDDHAMEPFLSRDGNLLFFNNRNEPPEKTDLHYARRVNDTAFEYAGKVGGSSEENVLDGVASMDAEGNFYFTSTRSYGATLSTIYRGTFKDGNVTGVGLVEGISKKKSPWLNMDAEISADGQRLYYTENEFNLLGGMPKTSEILVAEKAGDAAFRPIQESARLMEKVNSGLLEYAMCTSADELELFFTRADPATKEFRIMMARRNSTSEPFAAPQRIGSIEQKIVEGPTLSPDGKCLYYHAFDNGMFRIFVVRRA
jgi:hypothetical protein